MKIAGIDPGFNGAIAFLSNESQIVIDMPFFHSKKTKREYDMNEIIKIIERLNPDFALIEKSQAFPGQGVVSMFSIGFCYGLFNGIFSAKRISFQTISPKKWQKFFSIRGSRTKNLSFLVASRLFPNLELKSKRGKIKDGRCDALLIAEYARRNFSGIK